MVSSAPRGEPGAGCELRGAEAPARRGQLTVSDDMCSESAATDSDAFFRSLYAEHSASLHARARRVLADHQQAEDVVQETMLRAWRKSETLTPDRGSVGGWLTKVTHNISLDRLRAKRARPREVGESSLTESSWSVADHTDDALNHVVLIRAVAQLDPIYRAVLYEVYFADQTCAEAAEVLGIPLGTVKSRLSHALRTLRRALAENPIPL